MLRRAYLKAEYKKTDIDLMGSEKSQECNLTRIAY